MEGRDSHARGVSGMGDAIKDSNCQMKEQKNDGKALERAVHLIQETLLKNDPTLKGGNFTIELNKHITVDGTRHEIDVYVTAHPGTKYESIVLFECKDL